MDSNTNKRTESPIYPRRWTSEPTITITNVNVNVSSARPSHSRTSSAALVDSPTSSPMRGHHARTASTSGISNVKRTQNFAARAAAQRLAQVMASQTSQDDDNEEDDDDDHHYASSASDLNFRDRKSVV